MESKRQLIGVGSFSFLESRNWTPDTRLAWQVHLPAKLTSQMRYFFNFTFLLSFKLHIASIFIIGLSTSDIKIDFTIGQYFILLPHNNLLICYFWFEKTRREIEYAFWFRKQEFFSESSRKEIVKECQDIWVRTMVLNKQKTIYNNKILKSMALCEISNFFLSCSMLFEWILMGSVSEPFKA